MHRGDCVNKHYFLVFSTCFPKLAKQMSQNGCGVQRDTEKNNYNKRNQKFQAEKRRMDGKVLRDSS